MSPRRSRYRGGVREGASGVIFRLTNVSHWDTLGFMRMQQTAIRVPAADLTRLTALAKKEGLHASDLIRRAIREYLERAKHSR
jgi:Ribbon-helix-helix protein, copG family